MQHTGLYTFTFNSPKKYGTTGTYGCQKTFNALSCVNMVKMKFDKFLYTSDLDVEKKVWTKS